MIKRIARTAGFSGLLAALLLTLLQSLWVSDQHMSLAPGALEQQFILASLLTNAAFWLGLGLLSAWFFRRKPD